MEDILIEVCTFSPSFCPEGTYLPECIGRRNCREVTAATIFKVEPHKRTIIDINVYCDPAALCIDARDFPKKMNEGVNNVNTQ